MITGCFAITSRDGFETRLYWVLFPADVIVHFHIRRAEMDSAPTQVGISSANVTRPGRC